MCSEQDTMYERTTHTHIHPFLVLLNSDYVPMVELIGIHFQIRDDYLNLQSSQVQIKNSKQRMPSSFKDAGQCTII